MDQVSRELITCSRENIIFNLLLGLFIFYYYTKGLYFNMKHHFVQIMRLHYDAADKLYVPTWHCSKIGF